MTYHTKYRPVWTQFWQKRQSLPPHMPRLVLANCYQPRFVKRCGVTQLHISLLRHLAWHQLPTDLTDRKQGQRPIPLAAYVGAYLVRLQAAIPTFGALRRFLCDHPGLIWALGFPLVGQGNRWSLFDPELSVPTQGHLTKKLASLPNAIIQLLLDGQVAWFQKKLGRSFAEVVSIDTKHILAWVKENNLKTYIKEGRFDPRQQPPGDPDCKLGCKRKRNQSTPTKEGQPVSEKVSIGEY